ncbi:MAG TPA: metallopeptidase family protein [Acidobacteriota bacterium]|nr:metallopeptidase family protein [Acidobacteriota bacterium]
MDRRAFDRVLERALERIPPEFRQAMDNLEILVEDWPDPGLMEDILGDRKAQAYGLFVGVPLTERGASDWGMPPTVIYIFRQPLLRDFPDRQDLIREVEITLAHEIGHFMGFDEDTLTAYGYD